MANLKYYLVEAGMFIAGWSAIGFIAFGVYSVFISTLIGVLEQ